MRLLHNATNAGSFIVSSHCSEQTGELWSTNPANFHSPAIFRYGYSDYATVSLYNEIDSKLDERSLKSKIFEINEGFDTRNPPCCPLKLAKSRAAMYTGFFRNSLNLSLTIIGPGT